MEKWAQTLYVLVRGPDPIEIWISDVVIVSFDLDPVPGKGILQGEQVLIQICLVGNFEKLDEEQSLFLFMNFSAAE